LECFFLAENAGNNCYLLVGSYECWLFDLSGRLSQELTNCTFAWSANKLPQQLILKFKIEYAHSVQHQELLVCAKHVLEV